MNGSIIINGGKRLEGEIDLQGSKNSSLPILAACVLNRSETVLHNVPDIGDVKTMLEILRTLGCKAEFRDNTAVIDSCGLDVCIVPENLVSNMRSSVILLGALLAANKKVQFSYPGGCDIGLRPIDLHLKGLKAIGAKIEESHGYIKAEGDELSPANVMLDYPSVGATENLMLASVFTKGVTCISNAAKEPEIIDLQNFLNAMGARVYGAGTNSVYIEGVEKLHGCEYTVMPDRIVAGTYMCAAHVAGGKVFIKNCSIDHIKSPYHKLIESGLKLRRYSDGVLCESSGNVLPLDSLVTAPYPAFPTDLQPIFTSMLCYAEKGISIINETVFENRYNFVSQLNRMGANIKTEGRIAVVNCQNRLSGASVCAQDLRGGAALVVAALGAEGETRISNIIHINRGYENVAEILKNLGADVKEEHEKIQKKKKE